MMPVVTVSRVPMMISAPSIPGPRPRRSRDTGTGTPHRIEITERRGPRAGACAAATGESESKKLVLVFPSSPSPSSSRTLSAGCALVLSNFDIDNHIICLDTSSSSSCSLTHIIIDKDVFKHALQLETCPQNHKQQVLWSAKILNCSSVKANKHPNLGGETMFKLLNAY